MLRIETDQTPEEKIKSLIAPTDKLMERLRRRKHTQDNKTLQYQENNESKQAVG